VFVTELIPMLSWEAPATPPVPGPFYWGDARAGRGTGTMSKVTFPIELGPGLTAGAPYWLW